MDTKNALGVRTFWQGYEK